MKHPLNQTWDLEVFFAGGSDSEALQQFLAEVEQQLAALGTLVSETESPQSVEATNSLVHITQQLQDVFVRLGEASSFISCLCAANTKDKKAVQLHGRVQSISASLLTVSTNYSELVRQMPDDVWNTFLALPDIADIAFNLTERRKEAQEKLPPEQEALAGDLAIDGYHGWGQLYNTIVSHIRIDHEEDGKVTQLSAGQAHNKLSSPSREVRERVFEQWEEAWSEKADFCADALNRIAGFRLKLYEHRGWENVLKEPLDYNRMSQATLDAMWDTIVRNKPAFVKYLERKAKLLGVEKLSWCDVDAPLGSTQATISYDEGASFIVEQFRKFSSKLADYTEHAFDNDWIEVEDRPGKRPGGFCTSMPVSGQSRIFMTYAGTPSNVSTLAHELGHGYHTYVMEDLPPFSKKYAMNVAETASTFAEMIVSDSAVKEAKDEQEKLALLEDKIQRSIAFYMNIHARFLFETRFYEQRKSGLLTTDQLCQLMEEAQQEAYCGALGSVHPHFWASKLHFYITNVAFYNFPYTFGYLFSTGLYARALEEGASFADKYDALLRDTGSMTVEDLAQKHLGVDLTKPDFWQSAIDVTLQDVDQFLKMTE
ncbi:M3 family oligoendopeptidase [Paenibacillus sp. 481]|uniref:M3 family oligoendopeptidase n=1 Tax=Paenibacillus sp. 481 TaxID=2835869 RepID=UPI001E4EF24F|nr:M3 family oligoendopeptidase [Paenibacillus sp. 481]UHA74651.1 M3 family oligoendopeptidase [Paenibacillus sp. 481]